MSQAPPRYGREDLERRPGTARSPRSVASEAASLADEAARAAVRGWHASGPALRRAGTAVAHVVDEVEGVVVPALIGAGYALLRAIDDAEAVVVPLVQALGRWIAATAIAAWTATVLAVQSVATGAAREARRGGAVLATESVREARRSGAVLATETAREARLRGQALLETAAATGRHMTTTLDGLGPPMRGGTPTADTDPHPPPTPAAADRVTSVATTLHSRLTSTPPPATNGTNGAAPAAPVADDTTEGDGAGGWGPVTGNGATAAAVAAAGATVVNGAAAAGATVVDGAAAVKGRVVAAAGRLGARGGTEVLAAVAAGTVTSRPAAPAAPPAVSPPPPEPPRRADREPGPGDDFLPGGGRPVEPSAGTVIWDLLRGRDRRAEVRHLFHAVLTSVGALLLTLAVTVLAVALAANAAVPRVITEGSGAVSAELILPENVDMVVLQEPSSIFASDGSRLARLAQNWNRSVVPLPAIPALLRQAVITAEDRTFYTHGGYDPRGIGRAALFNLGRGEVRQGASTITQQLAKSIIGDADTILDKVEEVTYAVALERAFPKDVLLEQYLNYVYFGRNSYGVAAAADTFFGVPLEQVTIEQAALLAAMIRAPNTNDPNKNPELALFRRNAVIDGMVAEGYVDPAAGAAAKAVPIATIPQAGDPVELPFVVDAVQEEFLSDPAFAAFGATREERQAALFEQGLELHATVDKRLQALAEETLRANFTGDRDSLLGALATVDPASGRILAAASAWPYTDQTNFNLANGLRQPGSVTKPFVYAAALAQGFPVETPLSGQSPIFFENEPGWTRSEGGVENYGGRSHGQLDMRSALTSSVNTATVQLSQTIGIQRVIDLMGQMGINTERALEGQSNPAIALGGFRRGMSPIEAASAYGTFANGGVHVRAHWIDRIVDRNGNEIWRWDGPSQTRQALQPQVNATMVNLMQGVVTNGTARNAQIPGWPVAGKTGTTTGERDAWFVGYTPTLSTAMWYGYRVGNESTGETGGGVPARIWRQYMSRALENQAPVPFPAVAPGSGRAAPGTPTTVPDVRTLPDLAAIQQVTAALLTPQLTAVPSTTPRGTVLDQSPRGGTSAQSGDTVTLTVSNGEPPPPPAPPPGPPAPTVDLGTALIDLLDPRPGNGRGNGNGNANGQGAGRG